MEYDTQGHSGGHHEIVAVYTGQDPVFHKFGGSREFQLFPDRVSVSQKRSCHPPRREAYVMLRLRGAVIENVFRNVYIRGYIPIPAPDLINLILFRFFRRCEERQRTEQEKKGQQGCR